MRSYLLAGNSENPQRDAALLSVLAYAGLRPGEALGLRWEDVTEKGILVQRSIALGQEADTKTRQHRTVRLLGPLRADFAAWRLVAGRPAAREFVFPAADGGPLGKPTGEELACRNFPAQPTFHGPWSRLIAPTSQFSPCRSPSGSPPLPTWRMPGR